MLPYFPMLLSGNVGASLGRGVLSIGHRLAGAATERRGYSFRVVLIAIFVSVLGRFDRGISKPLRRLGLRIRPELQLRRIDAFRFCASRASTVIGIN